MAQWNQGQQGFQYPIQTSFPAQNQQLPQNPQFQQQNTQFQQRNPQFQPNFAGGIAPQPTSFPGQLQGGFQQPQQSGFQPQSGFQSSQPTGFQQPQQTGFQQPQQPIFAGGSNFLSSQPSLPSLGGGFQSRGPPPPVPPIPSQSQQGLGVQQANRFLSASPGLAGPGLSTQPTGYGGSPGGLSGSLVPQVTGFVDPRLQMMQSTFMPLNLSSPYGVSGVPQLGPPSLQGGLNLQQSIQQHNQQAGSATRQIPWALSKAEKKNYDAIFRAWDKDSAGFISGSAALEVFGQSGLDQNDLGRIWALADIDDKGKLNMAEFHVAMGLIYRRLNGNDIPDQLPPELIPPSSRDLDTSVNFLKEVLKNETRSTPSHVDAPVSRMKDRSFNNSAQGAGGRQDATVYKHTDAEPPGGFYTPSSRHVDRAAIRTRGDEDNPSADISDLKRQLENAAKLLDRSVEADASRTAEDDALDREMDDLRYRVKRVQDDLDYVSRGPRTASRDDERRKLERELLNLMHERLPELERKIEDRARRREREKREWERDRDRRNERFGRYDDRETRRYEDRDPDSYSSAPSRRHRMSSRERDGDRDRDRDRDGYSRGGGSGYDRDDRDRDFSSSRQYDRPRGPPSSRTAAPPPPPPVLVAESRPAPPRPSTTPAPMKNMTPEERKEYARAQAKRRIEERMAALGVTAPAASSAAIDTSVEDRLEQDKREAEEKAKVAERQAEERERLRKERLENEKALRGGGNTSRSPPAVSSPSVKKVTQAPVPAIRSTPSISSPAAKAAPPPVPRSRAAPVPPAPRGKLAASKTPAVTRSLTPAMSPTPPRPPAPAVPEVDPEEEAFRAREQAIKKRHIERAERLRQLEAEEEQHRKAEAEYEARRKAFLTAKQSATPPPPPAVAEPPVPPPPQPPAVRQFAPPSPAAAGPNPPEPPAPPTPPAQMTPCGVTSSTNPFSKLMKEINQTSTPAAVSTPPSANGGDKNPFFRSQTAPPPQNAPPPPRSPAPPAIKSSYNTVPDDEDEWDDVKEKDEDSSDDELVSSRSARDKIAQQLFGGSAPARSVSAGPESMSVPTPPPPAPPGPAPRSAPPVNIQPNSFGPPPPSPPPPPPPAMAGTPSPSAATPGPPGGRNALLLSIQGGAKLRKSVTNDRSTVVGSGRVMGDSAPPAHISIAPRPVSPPSTQSPLSQAVPSSFPAASSMFGKPSNNRTSVDWYAGLASADEAGAPPGVRDHTPLPGTIEEEEEEDAAHSFGKVDVPQNQLNENDLEEVAEDFMADIDTQTEVRMRSLYPYDGQRPEDLCFKAFGDNLVLTAHPSKSGGDWWHGTVVRDGKSGFFPKTYIQVVEPVMAKAIYSYASVNSDELPFVEGDELTIIDRSEEEWWKAEQGGVVFIVPAAYLEIQG